MLPRHSCLGGSSSFAPSAGRGNDEAASAPRGFRCSTQDSVARPLQPSDAEMNLLETSRAGVVVVQPVGGRISIEVIL